MIRQTAARPNRRVWTRIHGGVTGMASNVVSRALATFALCALAGGALAAADTCTQDGGMAACGGPNVTPWRYVVPGWVFYTAPGAYSSAQEALSHARSDLLLFAPVLCSAEHSLWSFSAPVYGFMGVETGNSGYVQWTTTAPLRSTDTGCSLVNTGLGYIARDRDVRCLPPYGSNGMWCVRAPDARDTYKSVGPQSCTACAVPSTPNPINIALGNKHQEEVDYRGFGSFPLTFTRYYNSLRGFNTLTDGQVISVRFGMHSNWRHSYERSIIVAISTRFTTALAYRPDGKVLRFNLSNGAYVGEADVNDRLQQLVDASQQPAGWQYTVSPTDEVETYDANGTLRAITNRAGLTQTLAYDGQERLTAVTDPAGRQLRFGYDSFGGRLSTLTDPAGQLITYAYDQNGDLTSVTYADGKVRAYRYNEASFSQGNAPHALTGILDENGDRYGSYTYDVNGVAIGAKNGTNANSYTLNIGSTSTEVTDPLGVKRTYTFKNVQGVARTTALSQACDTCGNANVQAQSIDANGNAASRTDWNGNRTDFTYDLTRNLETRRIEGLTSAGASTAATRTISTQWHASMRVPIAVAEPKRITTYAYDAQGNLTSKSIQATTDASGAAGFSATPTGSARTWTYTNTYSSTVPGLMVRQVIDGPRTDVADTTTTVWDNAGNLSSVTNALGHVTTLSDYDAHGRPRQISDPNGLVTTLTYDLRGRLAARNVGGEITAYSYDGVGLLTKVTLPDGSFLSYSYDTAHRLTGIADNLGNTIVYTLDAMGNHTQEQVFDPNATLAQRRARVYDNLNRLSQDIGGANSASEITGYGYDNQGNLTSVTDPLGHVSTSVYDALNRLSQVIDPAASGAGQGGNTQYAYDGLDQLSQLIDPRTLTTRYTLDGLGNLTQQVSPDSGTTANGGFDATGNLTTSTDARGVVSSFSYDALNRLTQAIYTPAPGSAITPVTLVYTYDQGAYGKGRLSGFSDPSGTTAYVYDQHGRLTQSVQTIAAVQFTTGYAYDPAGRLARMTYPSGRTLDYSFDASGRVRQIDTSYGNVTQAVVGNVAYQPLGAVKSFLFGNGSVYTREFDLDGRISHYSLGNSARTLNYDAASRITGFAQADPALNQSFGYDNLGRLTSWVAAITSQSYAYDLNGNRIGATYAAKSYGYTTPTSSNRLSAVQGPTALSYQYDAAGTPTHDGLRTFTADARGRVVRALRGSITSDYVYNALGQRVAKLPAGGRAVYFVYDSGGKLISESGAQGHALKEYIWLGDMPVAVVSYDADEDGVADIDDNCVNVANPDQRDPNADGYGSLCDADLNHDGFVNYTDLGMLRAAFGKSVGQPGYNADADFNGNGIIEALDLAIFKQLFGKPPGPSGLKGQALPPVTYFIYPDHLGTPRQITNQQQQVVWKWDDLDPFGANLPSEDVDGDGKKLVVNLRFPGQYFDQETGLHYNYFRDYDPSTGRYVQSDPIGLEGGINTYAYVFGYPVGMADEFGLEIDPKKFPLKLPERWGARVDQFNYGDSSSFEIHVCNPAGEEAGVVGPEGWTNKHGHQGRPPGIPDKVENSIKGIAVDQLRRRGLLPPKGQANIKGNNWIKKAAKACKRVCGPAASVLIVIGGLAGGDAPHEIAEEAACEAIWGCEDAH